MNRARGSLVINEMILPVVDIALRDEGLLITVAREMTRSAPPMSADSYTLMDESGRVVGWGEQYIEWPKLRAGDTLQTELFIRFDEKRIRPGRPRRPFWKRWS